MFNCKSRLVSCFNWQLCKTLSVLSLLLTKLTPHRQVVKVLQICIFSLSYFLLMKPPGIIVKGYAALGVITLTNFSTSHLMKEYESLQPFVLWTLILCDRYLYHELSKFKIHCIKLLLKGLPDLGKMSFHQRTVVSRWIKSKDHFKGARIGPFLVFYYVQPTSLLVRAHNVFAHVPDKKKINLLFVASTPQRLLLRSRWNFHTMLPIPLS